MKLQKFVVVFVISIIVLIVAISILSPSETNGEVNIENTIKGLEPADIYLNLENKGFKIQYNSIPNEGYLWNCKKIYAGISYEVNIHGKTKNSVESIRATAMISSGNKSIIATQQFFQYITSIPYADSDPNQSTTWLKDNFDKNDASINIANVSFTIHAPSQIARILNIEVVN